MDNNLFKEFEFHTDIYTDIVVTQTQLVIISDLHNKDDEDFLLSLTMRLLALNDCLQDTSRE